MSYKAAVRRAAPSLYNFILRVRRSDLVGRFESFNRYRRTRITQAANHGYFAVNIKGKMGFAAMLSQSIAALLYCEKHHLQPLIRFTNPLYSNQTNGKHNWLTDFFDYVYEPSFSAIDSVVFSDILGQSDYNRNRLDDAISIETAHNLFKRYLSIKQDAISEAKAFATDKFTGNVLGIHYRGTDKKYESAPVQYDQMIEFIGRVINKLAIEGERDFKIFVATDEIAFLDRLKLSVFRDRIIYFECRELGIEGSAIHFSPGDNHRKGIEALSTMYLLSNCSWCVKTTSQLSAWAKIINPRLRVFIPQRSFRDSFHFPDKQLWESRDDV